MEPQIIDYYNEMPMGINVIDKMNEELNELQIKYDGLNKLLNKYRIPCFKIDTVDEHNEWTNKLEHFTEKVCEIIKDEKNGLISVFNVSNLHPPFWDVASLYKNYENGTRELFVESSYRYITIVDKLSEELNKLTEYKNEEWSSYRITYSLKQALDYHKSEEIDNIDIDELSASIDQCIRGEDGMFYEVDPILYCNFIPTECEENKEYPESSSYFYNMIYYNCENCNKIGRHGGDPVDNRLLCYDCQN